MNLEDIEDGLLNYKEKEFIKFIDKNFMNERYINKYNLIENQHLLNSIDESIKNHVVAKLDQIIESYGNESHIISNITLSLTVLSLMIKISINDINSTAIIIGIILFVISILIFCQLILTIIKKKRKNTAVYFKTLLNNLKKDIF